MTCDQDNPIMWRTSTKSNGGACVEVAFHQKEVLIRDSKNRDGGIISVSPAVWQELISAIRYE